MASCCCGCGSGARAGASESPGGWSLDLAVTSADETSVTLGLQIPRPLRGRGTLQAKVQVFGGPSGDAYGPREEQFRVVSPGSVGAAAGRRVAQVIENLLPDTEYSVRMTLSTQNAVGSQSFSDVIEVRTAPLDSACAAADASDYERARQADKASDGKGKAADVTRTAAGGSSSSSAAPATVRGGDDNASTAAPSTAPPSEIGEEAASEAAPTPRPASARAAAGANSLTAFATTLPPQEDGTLVVRGEGEVTSLDDPIIEVELGEPRADKAQCNLCSMFNPLSSCWRMRTVSAQPAPPPSPPKRRTWRPHRPPFPGIPVDPASVGLGHLVRQA